MVTSVLRLRLGGGWRLLPTGVIGGGGDVAALWQPVVRQ